MTETRLNLTFERGDQVWALDGLVDGFGWEGEVEELPPADDGWMRRRPTGRSALTIRFASATVARPWGGRTQPQHPDLLEAAETALTYFIAEHGSDFDAAEFPDMDYVRWVLDGPSLSVLRGGRHAEPDT